MNSAAKDENFDDCLKAIGVAVRMFRKELLLSQEELAHRSGVDRSHMGKIERGERNVSINNIMRISRALECLPSDLLRHAGL